MEIVCAVLVILLVIALFLRRGDKEEIKDHQAQYKYMTERNWYIRDSLGQTIEYQSEKILALEKELDTYRKTYWPIPKKEEN
jgi:hypothetical protein